MKIKSYYFTKNKIVVKDYDNKTTILDLNRMNLMNMIACLDKQIESDIDSVITKEDKTYEKMINVLAIITIIELFLTYFLFTGFTHANYIVMWSSMGLSLFLVAFSLIYMLINAAKIRGYRKKYKIFEGREILVKKYNSMCSKIDAELIDVY